MGCLFMTLAGGIMINSLSITLTNDDVNSIVNKVQRIKDFVKEDGKLRHEYYFDITNTKLNLKDLPEWVSVRETNQKHIMWFLVDLDVLDLFETLEFIEFEECTLNVDKKTFKIIKTLISED